MTRRTLAGLILSIVLGVLLAACATTPGSGTTGTTTGAAGNENTAATEAAGTEAPSGEKQELHVYNWSTYISEDLIPKFEQQYNAKVTYDIFADNDELLAKIQPGNPGYDIIVPTDYMVEIMIGDDLLETLDKSKISNFGNIDDAFVDPPYDPGNDHCVPYQWGTVGLGYNEKATGGPIDSWDVMFNGEHAGRISWQTESRLTLGATLIYLGYDPNTTNPDEIAAARDKLLETKQDVVAFAPDTGQILLDQGEVDIAFEYSGDIFQIMENNPDIRYVIPKEGTIIWTDNLCIPKGAPNPDLAHKFIDFILDAQNGADLSNYTAYGTPNKASLPMIDEELRNNPGIYPSEETRKHMYFIKSLGDADQLYEDAWTKLGVGQ